MADVRELTLTDKKKLEAELEELQEAKKKVAEEIQIARGFGDLSENAEYDAAKKEEARVYGRIGELEELLRTSTFVDDSAASTDVVSLGNVVRKHARRQGAAGDSGNSQALRSNNMAEEINNAPEMTREELSEQNRIRLEKLNALKEAGRDPYTITTYDVTDHSSEIVANFVDETEQTVSIAGRIMSRRVMGKASFAHLLDRDGEIQFFARREDVG